PTIRFATIRTEFYDTLRYDTLRYNGYRSETYRYSYSLSRSSSYLHKVIVVKRIVAKGVS
ncbi:MAG: hypothetical protein KBS65_02400, partial [Prevotella sp.]|nr:hypothetical protein [Candidatus Equicola stercoris]